MINGRVVKHNNALVDTDLAKARKAVEQTVGYLQGQLGPEAWEQGMNPEVPETAIHENPYTYTR